MLVFRWLILLFLVAGLFCFAMFKWTVVAGLGFFAVLILERMAVIL